MNKFKIIDTSKTVLDSLRESFGVPISATCSGAGTCGKCKVKVISGDLPEIYPLERESLSQTELDGGYRLSCLITPTSDLEVVVDNHTLSGEILESHSGFTGDLNPIVKKNYITLTPPTLKDQRNDLTRIAEELNIIKPKIELSLLSLLPKLLKQSDYSITVTYKENKILNVETGDQSNSLYSIAFDIGTTTVVGYFLNSITGEVVDTISALNSQKAFGADVISRIDYTLNSADNLQLLHKNIVTQIGDMSTSLIERNSVKKSDVKNIVIAGNTTMLHLFAGVDPSGLATAPFVPAFLKGLDINSNVLVDFPIESTLYLLPSISAYVGGDIVAGVLATDMFNSPDNSLLVDLGTNGEIILGNRDRYYSCSTAAGPAFEGAHIQFGIGAIDGAVNKFSLKDGGSYSTINNKTPIGICGSAIVDIVSEFIINNIIDETGRFNVEELERDSRFISNGEGAYIIVPGSESKNGENILFTQKDIREVQLAKASVAAGIETLIEESKIGFDGIENLYIAGGFGNYIDQESAANIGLIPKVLLDRTQTVGNTAGLGAINCALSASNIAICDSIVNKTNYIELSSSSIFQMKYMEGMVF